MDALTLATLYCPEGESPPEWTVAAIEVAMKITLKPKTINQDYVKASKILGVYDHPYAGTRRDEFMMLKHAVRVFLHNHLRYPLVVIARYENSHHTTISNSIKVGQTHDVVKTHVNYLIEKYTWSQISTTNTKRQPKSTK